MDEFKKLREALDSATYERPTVVYWSPGCFDFGVCLVAGEEPMYMSTGEPLSAKHMAELEEYIRTAQKR